MTLGVSDLCRQLRLAYISDALTQKADPELSQLVAGLLQSEIDGRQRMKLNRLIHKADFPQIKTFEGYTFETVTFPGSVTKETLVSLSWIQQHENLLILGAVGTGKTHLAISLGVEACRRGHIVRFFRVADLVSTLQQKHADGTLNRFRRELLKTELVILDGLGYVPFHQTGSELLFHVIADCYERQSVIVTSNLEFKQWSSIFGDTKLTTALVDRLVHHAHILSFSGESYRLRNALGIQN